MKIRIRGNSIRYRLDKKDIQALQEEGQVQENTSIGAGALQFGIQAAGREAIDLAHNRVQLTLPQTLVQQWTGTEQVGFSLELPNADGSVLQILVEKDFKCLTERSEDDSHAFDNPAKAC